MVQWLEDPVLSLQWLGVVAVPQIRSLAQELMHAMGTAGKKKKKSKSHEFFGFPVQSSTHTIL